MREPDPVAMKITGRRKHTLKAGIFGCLVFFPYIFVKKNSGTRGTQIPEPQEAVEHGMPPIKAPNLEMGESGNIDQNEPFGVSTCLYSFRGGGVEKRKRLTPRTPYKHAFRTWSEQGPWRTAPCYSSTRRTLTLEVQVQQVPAKASAGAAPGPGRGGVKLLYYWYCCVFRGGG